VGVTFPSVTRIKTDAKESVSIVLDEYFENGVMGMIALSKDCHENAATSKINCIGIDVAAHLWDFNVTNSLKVPNEEYFSVSNNRIRAETYARIKNLNLVLDDYIQLLAEESYAQIPAEWEKQKHKLD
jgi:hypothetical protein